MKSHHIFVLLMLFTSLLTAQKEGLIKGEDGQLHYKIFGEGIPLLIINGGPGFSSEGFIPLAKELSQQYQVILYDQRGTGKSTLPEISTSSITMDLMVSGHGKIEKTPQS